MKTVIEKLEAEIADRNEQTAKLEKRLAELRPKKNKIKMWIATDKNGDVLLHQEKPIRYSYLWGSESESMHAISDFPAPKWEEEPIEVLITIQKA